MPDLKISQLTATMVPLSADLLPIVTAGVTKKITYANLIAPLAAIYATLAAVALKQNTLTSIEGIIAFAGGGQASATSLTATYNFIDTVATIGDSIKALSATANAFQYIQNNGANELNIYPQSGQLFKGLAANAPIAISAGGQLSIACATAGTWRYF